MDINHEYTKEIVCPCCGYKYQDSNQWKSDNLEADGIEECEKCGKEFKWYRGFEVWYNTEKIEELKNAKEKS